LRHLMDALEEQPEQIRRSVAEHARERERRGRESGSERAVPARTKTEGTPSEVHLPVLDPEYPVSPRMVPCSPD
jgi:hypothetical protein